MNKTCLLCAFCFFSTGQLFSQQKVGINTDTPEATLDVNGDMNIRELDAPDNNNTALTADGSGVLSFGADKKNQYSPFYTAEYKLVPTEAATVKANTNIPIKDYNMVLAYGFVAPLATAAGTKSVDAYWGISRVEYGEKAENDIDDLNAFKDIELIPSEETGTWFIKAQYSFAPNSKGTWTSKQLVWYIRVFIVPKNVMEVLATECYQTPDGFYIESSVENPLSKEANNTCN